MRHREDVRSLLFVALALALLVIPFFVRLPWFVALPWIALSCAFGYSTDIINHNHLHTPTFRGELRNELLEIALSISKGSSAHMLLVPHNLNHHVHGGNERDWLGPRVAGEGPGALRLLRYVVVGSVVLNIERRRPEAPRLPAKLRWRELRQNLAICAFMAWGLTRDWRTFLAYVTIPWVVGTFFLVAINLIQHDGCDPESRYGNSRNFTGRLGNWLLFNNGFHTIHHLRPALHWTKLREAHERLVRPHSPPELDEASLAAFIARRYLFS